MNHKLRGLFLAAGYKTNSAFAEYGFPNCFTQNTVTILEKTYDSIKHLVSSWEEDQDRIATEIQPQLDSESKWDLYFALMVPGGDSDEDVQAVQVVQTDTFCCRKLVINLEKPETIKMGLNRLPYFRIETKAEGVRETIRKSFVTLVKSRSVPGNLVEKCLDLSAADIAEVIISSCRKSS